MNSEKAIYWLAVFVLALGGASGFVNQHKGWLDRLADGSVILAQQASETALQYADIAQAKLDLGNRDFNRTQMAVVRVQSDIVCVQGALARRQAKMARVQAARIRAQVMERGVREFIAGPRQQVLIADDTF